jgi:DNA-binding NarL/FixJ family response regulator
VSFTVSEKDNFALVPRSPGALEKAEPGAKRILSGMVADTLTLVRKTKSQPLRVFIVYYEEAPRMLIKRTLQKQFERVIILEFERGDEAWQELSRTTPDLLITLDVMPGMPGEEIVRRLADKKATCPIIVLSGWGDRSEPWVRDFSNRGLNVSLLQIPFTQLTFLNVVETALKNTRVMIERSGETTLEQLRKAAEQGDTEAQNSLAWHYVDLDKSEHLKWLRKAADQGHEMAQVRLSIILWMGYLPEEQQDIIEAYKWSRVLANEPSRDHELINLEEKKKYMTPAQIQEGEAIAMEFLQKFKKQKHT